MNALIRLLVVGWILTGIAGAAPSVLKLNDGSVIKGDISPASPTATEVVVSTEFGVIRVPVDKISLESCKAAEAISPPISAALRSW